MVARMVPSQPHVRRLVTISILTLGLLGPGCFEDPCLRLKNRVCEEIKDKRRCKLMQDETRMEHLSGETCDEILKALKR